MLRRAVSCCVPHQLVLLSGCIGCECVVVQWHKNTAQAVRGTASHINLHTGCHRLPHRTQVAHPQEHFGDVRESMRSCAFVKAVPLAELAAHPAGPLTTCIQLRVLQS